MTFSWAVPELVKRLHCLPLCKEVDLWGLERIVGIAKLWYCPSFRYNPVLYRSERVDGKG